MTSGDVGPACGGPTCDCDVGLPTLCGVSGLAPTDGGNWGVLGVGGCLVFASTRGEGAGTLPGFPFMCRWCSTFAPGTLLGAFINCDNMSGVLLGGKAGCGP